MVVLVRRHYFSKRFEDVLLFNKARRMREEHRRKQRSSAGSSTGRRSSRSISTARPSAPIHLRKLRRSSLVENPVSTPSPHPYFDTSLMSDSDSTKQHQNSFDNSDLRIPSGHSKVNMWGDDQDTTCYPTDEENDLGLRLVNTCPSSLQHSGMDQQQQHDSSVTIHPTSDLPLSSNTKNNGNDDDDDNDTQTHDSIGAEATGIAFADDIEQQRHRARQRLEQERRFRETLEKLTQTEDPETGNEFLAGDAVGDEDEFDRIMREPIDKSQLTREQRNRIGGAEYRALDFLVKLVPAYYLGNVILFAFFFRIYIACSTYAQDVLRTTNSTGPIDPWFFSFFQSLSAFNNLGIMLCDDSMVPFQNAPAPLIFTMLLILFGNTAYAINLRFIVWTMYKLTPASRPMRRETLRYLLDHPRRCYTTLFPSTQTYWLLLTLVVITLVELVSFLALNYWLPVLEGINWGSRFIDGLFQSISTRNGKKAINAFDDGRRELTSTLLCIAGFAVVNLMALNPGTQLVYIVAMYISVYPVAISMRNSNVYQVSRRDFCLNLYILTDLGCFSIIVGTSIGNLSWP